MPSSMIFVGLVVLWLLILVPAVARHRQEVARPSVAALSGRVLERPRRRQNLEVDGMDSERARRRTIDDAGEPRAVATRSGREDARVPAARSGGDRVPDAAVSAGRAGSVVTTRRLAGPAAPEESEAAEAGYDDGYDEGYDEGPGDGYDHSAAGDVADAVDDRRWERPPPRYRPGRGGFDPEAAALAARARYGFRQRVVLAMLVAALVTGVVAVMAVPGLWWPHAGVDLSLVGYLVYLRRQVRMEESIRDRRAARLAGARGRPGAEDRELDEWARPDPDAADDDIWTVPSDDAELDGDDELADEPVRVTGTGAPLSEATELSDPVEEFALPRLQPAPPPALPAGTALVVADDEDPDLHDLDEPARPDYRRAVGE